MSYIPKQYDSAKAFLRSYNDAGNVVDPMDSLRVKCYHMYDDFYYNRPETFQVTIRGDSDTEIYLPSTKKIVDSTARFLAVDFDFTVKGGDSNAVETYLRNLFKREEIQKKFIRSKKSGLIRGDSIWYITADDRKPAGQRISINTLHPSCYFTIVDPNDDSRVIGCHLVDLVPDPREMKSPRPDRTKMVARRQTYRKEPDGTISTEAMTFEIGFWDDRNLYPDELKPVSIIWQKRSLPQRITQIPVYHIPNNEPDGSSWGMSQVSGVEYIINALNQSVTYEDLSLVLQGLGVYVTTSAPPKNSDGSTGSYKLHPGNVVEMGQGDTFDRVTGVNSVQPFLDHLAYLDNWMMQGAGLPDMAAGQIDVSVAQSGIALALKMGPIIAENSDKQLSIGGKWDQMAYDLIHMWIPTYDGLNSPATEFTSVFGDPMPINRDTYVQELINLYTAGLLLVDEVRQKLESIGYPYSKGLVDKLLEESANKANAAAGLQYPGEANASSPNLMDLLGSSVNSAV